MYTVYEHNSQGSRTKIVFNKLDIIEKIFGRGCIQFEILTAVGIKITVLYDVPPWRS